MEQRESLILSSFFQLCYAYISLYAFEMNQELSGNVSKRAGLRYCSFLYVTYIYKTGPIYTRVLGYLPAIWIMLPKHRIRIRC